MTTVLPSCECQADDQRDHAEAADHTEHEVVANAVGPEQTDEADHHSGDSDSGGEGTTPVDRRPPREGLFEQAVQKGDAADDDKDDEQRVARRELLELPFVGDPVLPAGGAALFGDRVDLDLADEALGQHDHHASDREERRQCDDKAR